MDKKSAEKQAMQIAGDLDGPLGRIPMERVIERHADFFDALRLAGATWPQIASLLSSAGVTRKDGRPMSTSQLRATFSRVMATQSAQSPSPQSDAPLSLKPKAKQPRTDVCPPEQMRPISPTKDSQSIRRKMQQASKARQN